MKRVVKHLSIMIVMTIIVTIPNLTNIVAAPDSNGIDYEEALKAGETTIEGIPTVLNSTDTQTMELRGTTKTYSPSNSIVNTPTQLDRLGDEYSVGCDVNLVQIKGITGSYSNFSEVNNINFSDNISCFDSDIPGTSAELDLNGQGVTLHPGAFVDFDQRTDNVTSKAAIDYLRDILALMTLEGDDSKDVTVVKGNGKDVPQKEWAVYNLLVDGNFTDKVLNGIGGIDNTLYVGTATSNI